VLDEITFTSFITDIVTYSTRSASASPSPYLVSSWLRPKGLQRLVASASGRGLAASQSCAERCGPSLPCSVVAQVAFRLGNTRAPGL